MARYMRAIIAEDSAPDKGLRNREKKKKPCLAML